MTFERHRDKNGEISRKHGNTLIRTLRKHYGASFAVGCDDDEKLGDVLHKLDQPSLTSLVRAHEAGKGGRSLDIHVRCPRRNLGLAQAVDAQQILVPKESRP